MVANIYVTVKFMDNDSANSFSLKKSLRLGWHGPPQKNFAGQAHRAKNLKFSGTELSVPALLKKLMFY